MISRQKTHNSIREEIEQTLDHNPDRVFDLQELIDLISESDRSSILHIIWEFIDQDKITLTDDRRLKNLTNRKG